MKAAMLLGFGDVDNLVLADLADPTPAPGQVLVRVKAAGINFADVLWRRGKYPRCTAPHVLGFEVAGDVEAIGEGVTGYLPGMRVFGFTTGGGGYAEKVLCRPDDLHPIPEGLTYEEAAAVPVVFSTVYHALNSFGRLTEGETVLIHAAGGGVGTVAVQWARAMGATVIATAGSEEKLRRVAELGAHITVNYRTQELIPAVKAANGNQGVDLVLESVGGQVLEDSLTLLRSFGRLVTLGIASGEAPKIDPMRLLTRNLTVSGLYLSTMEARLVRGGLLAGLATVYAGKVRPVVGHTYPLDQVARAHALLESRNSFGKVVLTV